MIVSKWQPRNGNLHPCLVVFNHRSRGPHPCIAAISTITSKILPDHAAAVTASELLHGLYRARTVAQRHRRQGFVEGLLAQLPVIPFDLTVARVHASLWADLSERGVVIGERDLMIGATAVAKDYSSATRDERSFPKIPGLRVRHL